MTSERAAEDVLRIRNLRVRTRGAGSVDIIDGVDLDVAFGQTVALVGESGSGKSMAARSVLKLLPPNLTVSADELRVTGVDVATAGEDELRRLRGDAVGMIFQDPMANFNPVLTVGEQIVEPLRIRKPMSNRAARALAAEALGHVGITDPESRAQEYPHQFSGGMLQRAMIAMALVNRPRLIVADEPTTALDATLQIKIVELLRAVQAEVGAGVLLITHDLGLVAELADRAAVMYGGRVLESGAVADLFQAAAHPYTRALLDSRPERGRDLQAIPGEPATPATRPSGCAFHPRCQLRAGRERCATDTPVLLTVGGGWSTACHFRAEMAELNAASAAERSWSAASRVTHDISENLAVRVDHVSKEFASTSFWGRRRRNVTKAVTDVSFEVRRGETLGLVGESGSGKSTLGRLMIGMLQPDAGAITVFDQSGAAITDRDELRRTIQWVHQDPYGSLNPKMKIGNLIEEVLARYRLHQGRREERCTELLAQMGLPAGTAQRYPHQLSGGQRQRVSIARALAVEPSTLVLDEPLSALDVSIQAQVITLLRELRSSLGLSYILISHDLNVVRAVCDRVAVMCKGNLVEFADAEQIYEHPQHPYTKTLLAAMLSTEDVRRAS